MPSPLPSDLVAEFVAAACVPRDTSHSLGTIDRADELLRSHPALASANIHTAAIVGDDAAVCRFLEADPGSATAIGGPHGWDALTHLCFSNYLKFDRSRSDAFVRAATALLDAGASATTGFFEVGTDATREFECVLYGASGVAHHPEMTRLLLARGADANDIEVVYHTPESYDNEAMYILVESERLTDESLATVLLRKLDWQDVRGVRWLLEHGADPGQATRWSESALHHALSRDNDLEIIQMLLDYGGSPAVEMDGVSAIVAAARCGRGDVLDAMARRGIPLRVDGSDALLAACARGHVAAVRAIADSAPHALEAIRASAGRVISRFAGIGNGVGLTHLLNLGIPVDERFDEGSGYFEIAPNSTALHVAAWRARHGAVRLLLERGAQVDARDDEGSTPLALAVRACVDSYWTGRRSPESVELLLAAGASVDEIPFPCGYDAVDALLAERRTR